MDAAGEESRNRRDEETTVPVGDSMELLSEHGGRIGQYRLLSILGEGGHGIVYLAEQQGAMRRRAALKVIKPGMDTKQVVARFEAERQALAVLDHPNIASVYDAGTTEAGRPYFVMEHVKGVSITEHCDRQRSRIEDRLALFLQVCDAVQHAHQKGIIHRDIKPSNILVSIEANQAVPKIIDFGVAKALGQSLTEQTLVTARGQMLGTPEYMSPEQAEMMGDDVDTRSDIYSLGVVLYELLTGVLPFDPKELRQGGIEHIRHVICIEEPATPSTRISRLDKEGLTKLAQYRSTDPGALFRKLSGDLDWITLKAMEKDRTRRYTSVGEFVADIKRHLNHEPVHAGSPSTVYRLRKFVRRNRTLVAGIAAVLFVLLSGIVVSTILAFGQARARVETQEVADFLTNDVLGLVVPEKTKGTEVTIRYVLDAASANLETRFKGKPQVEASIRQTLGETYRKLGDYKSASLHLEKAYAVRRAQLGSSDPATLTSMSQLGWLYCLQTRYDEAESLLTNSYEERLRVLGTEHPDTLESMAMLGGLYYFQMKLDQAEEILNRALTASRRLLGKDNPITLDVMKGLVIVYMAVGRDAEAEPLCLEGYETSGRTLGLEHEVTLIFMSRLAGVYTSQGRYDEANPLLSKALETSRSVLGDEHPVTLECMYYFGTFYKAQGQYEEAEKLLTKSLEGNRLVLGEDHIQVMSCTYRLSVLYGEQGRYDHAEALLVKLIENSRRVLGENHLFVSSYMWQLCTLYAIQGRYDEAQGVFVKDYERQRREKGDNDPALALPLHGLAWLQATHPVAELRNGKEAILNATKACELTNWDDGSFIDTLAAAYAEAGDFETAVKWQKKAIALVTKPWHHMLDVGMKARLELYESGKSYHASPLRMNAELSYRLGRDKQAEREFIRAFETSRRLFGERHEETMACVNGLVSVYESIGDQVQAEFWREKLHSQSNVEK